MPDALGLEPEFRDLKTKHLYRSPEVFASRSSPKKIDRFVDFSSNDYLGLSQHPRVIAGASRALKAWGAGSAASRLLSGNLALHERLERRLARFKGEQAATVFSSGYLANLGAIGALAGEKDVVVLDRLCHASLIDAARLSRAKFWVYRHREMGQLDGLLKSASGFRRRLVITDGYFSMDGVLAPLPELVALCRRHEALLYVDEAHSTGAYGAAGRGVGEHWGLEGRIDVVMGTLSKALGSGGGFVAGSKSLRRTLVNFCRPYIYTTAPVPAASGAALAALEVLERTPHLVRKLWKNTERLRKGLAALGIDAMGSEGPIVPLRVGDPARTVAIREKLKARGFFVSAIRQPSVPEGTDRIRLSVSAAHTETQIQGLLEALRRLRKDLP